MRDRQEQDRDFGFCPLSGGKPLKDFKQRDDVIKLAFLRDPSGFHAENGLGGAQVHIVVVETQECI